MPVVTEVGKPEAFRYTSNMNWPILRDLASEPKAYSILRLAAATSLTKPRTYCYSERQHASCIAPRKELILRIAEAVPTYKAHCWWAKRLGVGRVVKHG